MSAGGDVYLAWCAPSHVTTMFLESVVCLYQDDRTRPRIRDHVTYLSSPHLAVSRHGITEMFLASGAPWLLQIDSDMVFTPDHVLTLLQAADAAERPIVAGHCKGFDQHDGQEVGEAFRTVGGRLEPVLHPPANCLMEVALVGTGFLLVHRDVFLRMRTDRPTARLPWWDYSVVDGDPYAEDYTFCERARQAGYRIWVHTGVRIGHVKAAVVRP
ncbi:hypothetical protein BJ965_001047 [Streptomyces luteogriseus]|uniref:Glycosyltransferase n=1 Tax=Streptomyces luteogriseus TaxID=68233 RepID=A0A7W7DK63_9ACTN|nr:hypothetical protein [Streptomyces luteogriseus]MBB4711165.1 hypothetical protein [Streptomyces luteogriseus]